MLTILAAAFADDLADGERLMAPLRQLTEGGVDLVQPMPYTAFQAMIDPFSPPGWLNYHRGQHVESLTDEVLDDYLAVGRTIGPPMSQGVIFRHGGAVSRVPEDGTAAAIELRPTWLIRSPVGRIPPRPTGR